VRHDRSHLPIDKRSGAPPARVMLSPDGWDLLRKPSARFWRAGRR
jgi:hypothetical protein